MRLILTLGIFVVLSACASAPVPQSAPAYKFHVLDEPQNRRFVFEFVSMDDRDLCISGDDWAIVDNDGALAGPQTLQTALGPVKASPYFFTDAGMVCGLTKTPDCGRIRVEPQQSLHTEVAYSLFGDPETLAKDGVKHFNLHKDYPFVEVCKSNR